MNFLMYNSIEVKKMNDTLISKTITERIIEELCKRHAEIYSYKEQTQDVAEKRSYNKILGNAVAMTLRNYISKISIYHDLDFIVSDSNAYIKGCPIEWDLILLKKNVLIDGSNIYDISDVKAVIEFKTSGTVDVMYKTRSKEEFLTTTFGRNFDYLEKYEKSENRKIPFLYISFSHDSQWFEATKEYFDSKNKLSNTAFAFIDDDALVKGHVQQVAGCENFEEYLYNIMKGVN